MDSLPAAFRGNAQKQEGRMLPITPSRTPQQKPPKRRAVPRQFTGLYREALGCEVGEGVRKTRRTKTS